MGGRAIIIVGVVLLIPLLFLMDHPSNLFQLFIVYLLIQVTMNVVQAGQQGFIPDRVSPGERGVASGLKNLMDIGGALLSFMLLASLFSQQHPQRILPIITGFFIFALIVLLLLVPKPARKPAPQYTDKIKLTG